MSKLNNILYEMNERSEGVPALSRDICRVVSL